MPLKHKMLSKNNQLDENYRYWTKQAIEFGQSPSASWSDHYIIEMEIREIGRYLERGDNVLDVGCANGFSTIQYAMKNKIQITGVDYIPVMIKNAKKRCSKIKNNFKKNIRFMVGNIMNLKLPSNKYEKVVSTRVIINLSTWQNQLMGIKECIRVLKPGGLLLLSEATLQGWKRMNSLRREWGLEDIPMPSFNTYLDEKRIIKALSKYMDIVAINNYSSTYYIGTRILKPLLAKTSEAVVNVADPKMEWNRWFSQLPAFGDYGTQKLLVFQKNKYQDAK